MNRLPLLKTSVLCLLISAGLASAAPPAKEPRSIFLTVQPAALPAPALKHRLLPPAIDRTPGDAAPLYLQAAGAWPHDSFVQQVLTAEQAKAWNAQPDSTWQDVLYEAPLEKLKSPELDRSLQSLAGAYPLLELASKRERCDWALPLREQGFMTLLPHLQTLRSVSRIVCIKARSELARGDLPGALATLGVNFALVRHLDQQAVLVQQLVATAIATLSLEVLQEAVALPECPNLYWALADLPTPLLDINASLELERATVYWSLPELQKVRQGDFTSDDWRALNDRLRSLMSMEPAGRAPSLKEKAIALATAMLVAPKARQYLVERGMAPEEADKLPKWTIIARYYLESYEEVYDDMVKWTTLPYPQSRMAMQGDDGGLEQRLADQKDNPLLLVVPSVTRAVFVLHRLDRQVAALQTVEAIRAYADANDGKLPAKLEDLKQTPPPVDPMTGNPFVYKVDGAAATLESLEVDQPENGLVVKVTIAR